LSPASPDAHLILVGLPGAGKSTVGRRVARRLGRAFVDFDREIERRSGLPIPRIFEELGEPRFRELEMELTRELAGAPPAVLAPGGGWITVPGALALLRPPGRMIYLRVRPDVALLRMGRRRELRPLLRTANPEAELARLLRVREPAYLQADHVVDVDRLGIKRVIAVVSSLAAASGQG
jgi:shikimate kinase